MIELGLSALLRERFDLIQGKSVGLVTNPTGVDENLQDNISLFLKHPEIHLKAVFAPEHGLWAAVQDAIAVSSIEADGAKIPVYSLYGNTRKPTDNMLAEIDVLIFDIQDVGARFYTFVSTMAMAMESCAHSGVAFIVLDRPNPINGLVVEGGVLDLNFRSFIGYLPIPIRHGMTIGELARFYNMEFAIDSKLDVVKMGGWHRDMWFDDTGLQWIMPSPNMPTLNTAIVYPGTCLFEGTNISEGRGTTRPFEFIGAPWIDAHQLTNRLNKMPLDGVKFRPARFIPTFSKYKGQTCEGVQLHILDRQKFAPVRTALTMIDVIRGMYPDEFEWLGSKRKPFDLLTGTDKVRRLLTEDVPIDSIIASWQDELHTFCETRQKYLLY